MVISEVWGLSEVWWSLRNKIKRAFEFEVTVNGRFGHVRRLGDDVQARFCISFLQKQISRSVDDPLPSAYGHGPFLSARFCLEYSIQIQLVIKH